jgi:hypothetical protein
MMLLSGWFRTRHNRVVGGLRRLVGLKRLARYHQFFFFFLVLVVRGLLRGGWYLTRRHGVLAFFFVVGVNGRVQHWCQDWGGLLFSGWFLARRNDVLFFFFGVVLGAKGRDWCQDWGGLTRFGEGRRKRIAALLTTACQAGADYSAACTSFGKGETTDNAKLGGFVGRRDIARSASNISVLHAKSVGLGIAVGGGGD